MSIFKCKMCGGDLNINAGDKLAECEFCGTKQTVSTSSDERVLKLVARGNLLRSQCEFDKAQTIFEQVVSEEGADAEAYWNLLLCKYGITYVDDYDGSKKPTINRMSLSSIKNDSDYLKVKDLADVVTLSTYEAEVEKIAKIQDEISTIIKQEKPYDIFISYKETDEFGGRTRDSVLAQEIHQALEKEGYRVFLSRVSLSGVAGQAYEPYIYSALYTSKMMILVTTNVDYVNAVWVKNEWTRFIGMMKKDPSKKLVPCFKDIDAYDLPKEISNIQGLDMSKLGFIQDLIVGVNKVFGRTKEQKVTPVIQYAVPGSNVEALLKRAYLFLEDKNFDSADEYAEKVLDQDPENGEAYLVKLLVETNVLRVSDLVNLSKPLNIFINYAKVVRFASPETKSKIESYNKMIVDRIQEKRNSDFYKQATDFMHCEDYEMAIEVFKGIKDYKDSNLLIEKCYQLIKDRENEKIYLELYSQIGQSTDLFKEDKRLEELIEKFKAIQDYKDVSEIIFDLQNKISGVKINQEKEIERRKIEAENERLRKERLAYEAKIKKAKIKEKRIRMIKIGTPILAVITILVILTFTFFIPKIKYTKANKLLSSGQYEEARQIYSTLGNFSKSQQRLVTIASIEKIEQNNYESAVKDLLNSGIPVKINYLVDGGYFNYNNVDTYGSRNYAEVTESDLSAGETAIYGSRNYAEITAYSNEEERNQTISFNYSNSNEFKGIKIPSKKGYTFSKWQLEDYSYQIDGKFELTLLVVWTEDEYRVTYVLNGGTNNSNNPKLYTIETAIIFSNPTKNGYNFVGWYSDSGFNNKVTEIAKGSTGNKTLYAKWSSPITYTITYNLGGGTNDTNNPGSYTVESATITLSNATRTGYTFAGWYSDASFNNKVTEIAKGSTGDKTLYAKFLMNYTITYYLDGGTNNENNPATYTVETETITLARPTKENWYFAGWYSANTFDNQVTKIVKGTTGNIILYAKWTTPPYTIKINGTIDFGFYPQTKVTDSSLVSSLTTLAGTKPSSSNSGTWTSYKYYIGNSNTTDFMWYKDISYNGDKYRAVYFTSYRPYFTDYSSSTDNTKQNNNGYYINTLYFFKFEPVNWRILTQSNGKALLMCNMIIDSQEYYYDNYNNRTINGKTVYANNYAESNIRKWLNDTFYNTAFSDLQKQIIQLTNVDNSARSTNPNSNATYWNSGNNSYACENTNDYVFLLSEQEVTNSAYGFNSSYSDYDTARRMKSTDYAQSQGASLTRGNGYWLLRSAGYSSCDRVSGVTSDGNAPTGMVVYSTGIGVVPALWITL